MSIIRKSEGSSFIQMSRSYLLHAQTDIESFRKLNVHLSFFARMQPFRSIHIDRGASQDHLGYANACFGQYFIDGGWDLFLGPVKYHPKHLFTKPKIS